MKMKRLMAWILVFVMCFMLVSCKKDAGNKDTPKKEEQTVANSEENEKNKDDNKEQSTEKERGTATPLLYRVTDEEGNVIWLFGSIHIGREEFYPLPNYVQEAFDNSDALAVELDIVTFEKDMQAQMNALSSLIYDDGTKISDHIPEELYDKSVEILKEYKSYTKLLDSYCPAFWGSMIESVMMEEMGGDVELGIDRHLIDLAYDMDKDILEVESAEFQYQMMADFDEDIQLMLLSSAIQYYEFKEEAAEELKNLMELWASGDENAFAEYLNSDEGAMTKEEKRIYERYNQVMIVDRNLTMTDFAEEALESGQEVFICVGAAHIVGEGAMVDILTQRGYTVELVMK